MKKTIDKKIENFIRNRYLEILANGKELKNLTRTNFLIKSYFIEKMPHLAYEDNKRQRKFFFSFRTKYLKTFKRYKQLMNSTIYQFSNSKKVKEFKSRFNIQEWNRINGDRLIKFLALEKELSARTIDLKAIEIVLRISKGNYIRRTRYKVGS